jgi:uncharacterized protein YciW
LNDPQLVEKLKQDDYSDFDEKMAAAFEYAKKLTKFPSRDFTADLEGLKAIGWSAEAILEIILVVSYFNMMNRIAAGLNVSLNEGTSYAEHMYGEHGRMTQLEKNK